MRYRELRKRGVGAVVKHTAVVSPDEEQVLWDSKVVGNHDPLALQIESCVLLCWQDFPFERWPRAT